VGEDDIVVSRKGKRDYTKVNEYYHGYKRDTELWAPEELGNVSGYRCYVYFIQCDVTKRVKIGLSMDPKDRLKKMQAMCPTELSIIYQVKTRSEMEEVLHERFAKYRLHGEWFEYGEEIKQFVELYKEQNNAK